MSRAPGQPACHGLSCVAGDGRRGTRAASPPDLATKSGAAGRCLTASILRKDAREIDEFGIAGEVAEEMRAEMKEGIGGFGDGE